jgi:ribosomal protein L29
VKKSAKAELRAKSAEDLRKEATTLREQLFRGRMAAAVEGKGLGGKARQMRRQIARIETFLNQQATAGAAAAAPAKPAAKTAKPAAKTAKTKAGK